MEKAKLEQHLRAISLVDDTDESQVPTALDHCELQHNGGAARDKFDCRFHHGAPSLRELTRESATAEDGEVVHRVLCGVSSLGTSAPSQMPTASPPVLADADQERELRNAIALSLCSDEPIEPTKSVHKDIMAVAAEKPWRLDQQLSAVPQAVLDGTYVPKSSHRLAVNMLQPRAWIETNVEMQAVANALRIRLVVNVSGQNQTFEPSDGNPVVTDAHVKLQSAHYVAVLPNKEGQRHIVDAVSQGDCFYGSVGIATNYRRLHELVQAHQRNDAAEIRSMLAQEYPNHPPLDGQQALFNFFVSCAVMEIRQRSAAALVEAVLKAESEAVDDEAEMLARALAEGDLPEIKIKLQLCFAQAESLSGMGAGAAWGAFKGAVEALVHAAYLLDIFYADPADPQRTSLLRLCETSKRIMAQSAGAISPQRRNQVWEELNSLYPGRDLPNDVTRVLQR